MKLADPIAAIGSSGHLDMPALVEWVNQNRLDPNDPANSTILYHVKVCCNCASYMILRISGVD